MRRGASQDDGVRGEAMRAVPPRKVLGLTSEVVAIDAGALGDGINACTASSVEGVQEHGDACAPPARCLQDSQLSRDAKASGDSQDLLNSRDLLDARGLTYPTAFVRRASHAGSGAATQASESGLALVLTLTAIAILTVFLADLHQETGTAFSSATGARDQLQAEYMAKSSLNLTRLLVSQEPTIRALISPMYQMMMQQQPPQLPVWKFADMVLQPFCDPNFDFGSMGLEGFDMGDVQGLGNLPGSCQVLSSAESSKINVNAPQRLGIEEAKRAIAFQLYGLTGGPLSPSPYDDMFSTPGRGGLRSNRNDVIGAVIDWWDEDTSQTTYDPSNNEIGTASGEDDVYSRLDEPYPIKNAPFDSIEELRMVRGFDDDFWATFVEPTPNDPESRQITVYGAGQLNPNEASPQVLLGTLCSALPTVTLCTQPQESTKFVQLILTARSMAPLPFFSKADQFISFLEGKGGQGELYPMLVSFLGEGNPLMFQPVQLDDAARAMLQGVFGTQSNLISIHATGDVGRARVTLRTVVNFDKQWTPPPPNAGSNTGLGVVQYYRVN